MIRSHHCRGAVLALLSGIGAFAAQARADQPFDRYPTTVYRGRLVLPDFAGRERQVAMFRTRIGDDMREGPDFAGHYKVIQFGCGTGCSIVFVGDVASGRVYEFPHGGENDQGLSLEYRVNSTLLRAWWSTELPMPGARCLGQDYLFSQSKFSPTGEQRAFPCPNVWCQNGICKAPPH